MNASSRRHFFSKGLGIVAGLPAAIGLATLQLGSREAAALPADRAYGRQGARHSRQDGRQGARQSRQTGRQVSRARRRGYYTLPPGYTRRSYGRYNYYFAGGRWYYPYMHGGRTVYVQVEVDASGNPTPPPPPSSIEIYF